MHIVKSLPKPVKISLVGVTILSVVFVIIHLFFALTTPKTSTGMWQQDHHGYRYRNADGSYITKTWATINGKQYYFDGNGYIVVNRWVGDSYVGKDGVKVSNTTQPQKTHRTKNQSPSSPSAKNPNWRSDTTGTWYQNPDGSYPTKRWEKIDDKWYYFNDKGYLLTNQWVGDYYVGSDGVMLTSTATPDNYIVDAEGRWIRNINRTAVGVIREALRLHLSRAKLMEAMQEKHVSYEDSTTATESIRIDFANHANIVAQAAINRGGYSRKGLIKYLTTGLDRQNPGLRFTEDEAKNAVANLNADYIDQAKKKAQSLASANKNLSKSDIAKLLKNTYYFTEEEAQRGSALQ